MILPDTFLRSTLDLLASGDHYGVSESVEIAKGKWYLPNTFKGAIKQFKRQLQWERKSI